jgi:SAM-dependent methyltransferase
MSGIVDRYDIDAAEYARYWGPVLERTGRQLLDYVELALPAAVRRSELRDARILDVGAGIGTLAFAALDRWPAARVVATDAAAGMLEMARVRLGEMPAPVRERLELLTGPAEKLPLPDASVDAAMSSFVLQLVPDRQVALKEIRRVLRPGAPLVYVTWLDREAREPFPAADEFDEAVYDLEIDEPEYPDEPFAGDVPSGRDAADELREAGFVRASAREETLVYDWTFDSYLEYKLQYDERSLMSQLSPDQQASLERNARERLGKLRAADFRWHAPVVFARGYAPR